MQNYKYDVAFSFLTEDEPLAQRINGAIKSEIKTFLYTEHQEKLTGNDAVHVFPEIFKTEARVVVVFYRNGWGETKMTGIEAEAIKSRRYEQETYKFLFIIKTDPASTTPDWIPGNYIWHDLDRFGEDAILPLIIQKVRENDGTPHKATLEEQAAQLVKQQAFEKKRVYFLGSADGVAAANDTWKELFSEFEQQASNIKKQGLTITTNRNDKDIPQVLQSMTVIYSDYRLFIKWYNSAINTLLVNNDPANLEIEIWQHRAGSNKLNDIVNFKPRCIGKQQYFFDLTPDDKQGWRAEYKDKFFTSKRLAEHHLSLLIHKD